MDPERTELTEPGEQALNLLRQYVDDELIDGGDDFGAWDDDVHELVQRCHATYPSDPMDEQPVFPDPERTELTMDLTHYTLTVDARSDLTGSLRGMDDLIGIVCEGLERRGFTENDYYVEASGPPELHIGVTRDV